MKRIIVSLDDFKLFQFANDERILKIKEYKENLHAIKLSATSFDSIGYITEATKLPIFYDHQKLADIPETIEKIVNQVSYRLAENKDAVIMLGYVGSKSIETFVNSCRERNLEPYVVCKMSHEKGYEFLKEDSAEKICEVSLSLGANGIICPVWDFELIKKCRKIIDQYKVGANLVTVGLRDIETAKKAINCGADYLITGTYFFNSPKNELEKLFSL